MADAYLARGEASSVAFDAVDCLDLVADVQDDATRAAALGALARLMSPDDAAPTFDTALDIASASADWLCSAALASLAPMLPASLLPRALDVAIAIRSDDRCAQALASLAPLLPQSFHARILQRTNEMGKWYGTRDVVLIALARVLPDELIEPATAQAVAIDNIHGRAKAIGAIASRLPHDIAVRLLRETIRIAATDPYQKNRAGAVAALAPVLQADLLPEVLRIVDGIDDDMDRANTLSALIQAMMAESATILNGLTDIDTGQPGPVDRALLRFANAIAGIHRGQSLGLLRRLASEIKAAGGDAAINEICAAICTTARWQP